MPQVYWVQAHNPGAQIERTTKEFAARTPSRPIVPTGAAFRESGWQPTVAEVQEFLQASQRLNLSAANFWVWDDARSGVLPGVWEAIRAYNYPGGGTSPKDICQRLIVALNTRDPNQVVALYTPTAGHVTSARTVQGTEAIRTWYTSLFNQLLPNATFTLAGFSGTGPSRQLTWSATSSAGKVQNGSDTLGIINDQISYHFQNFTVTK